MNTIDQHRQEAYQNGIDDALDDAQVELRNAGFAEAADCIAKYAATQADSGRLPNNPLLPTMRAALADIEAGKPHPMIHGGANPSPELAAGLRAYIAEIEAADVSARGS